MTNRRKVQDKKAHFKRDESEDDSERGSDWEDEDMVRMKLVEKAYSGAGGANEQDSAEMKEDKIGRSLLKAANLGVVK